MDSSPEVLDYVARLSTGSHALFLYETVRQASEVFRAYLDGAIDRGEAIFFTGSSHENLRDFLGLAGAEVPSLEKDGILRHVPLWDFCFEDWQLSRRKAWESVQGLLRGVAESGLKGARVILLADRCLRYAMPKELVQFEREWGISFDSPVSVICSYDVSRMSSLGLGSLMIELIRLHGHGIFKGLVSQNDEKVTHLSTVAT